MLVRPPGRGGSSDAAASAPVSLVHVLRIACRPSPDDAGAERWFDFSCRSVAARWAGERDMDELIGRESIFRDFHPETRAGA